jgi:hypothetical protein
MHATEMIAIQATNTPANAIFSSKTMAFDAKLAKNKAVA